jgi:nitroreductase
MEKRIRYAVLRFVLTVLAATIGWTMTPAARSLAAELAPVQLPPPQTDGGKPLMQALALRATSRAFAPDPIPAQTLSNLLWAAWGINRPAEGKRTAPSARNWQEIDLMVVRADGTFLYDAAANRLRPVAPGDHRALTGVQPFVKDAPLTLLLVADTSRMKGAEKDPEQRQWLWADAGFISQNIYLFCASEGLATGVRARVDRPALAKALGLREHQVILMAQCVGRPASVPGTRGN